MSTASTLQIFSTTGKFVTAFGDVPALSVLKPIGGILVTICDHVMALKDNEEAAIIVAERVDQAVRVLINHTRGLDGATQGSYLVDIKIFERTLLKISSSLQNLRQRNGFLRFFSPSADASELNRLCSELNYTIQIFSLSANCETRLALQTLQTRFPKGGSEPRSSTIDPSALRPDKVIVATNDYSVYTGRYDNQAVVVKKYYTAREERFMQDVRQRRNLIYPGIACVIGTSDEASIMLLCAEDLILCLENTIDIHKVRDPWKQKRIGPQVVSGDMGRGPPSTSHLHSRSGITRAQVKTLTIKESDALLHQFTDIMLFLRNMRVAVDWWEFKPSWVGFRGTQQVVLIDWDQDRNSKTHGEFNPQYAIHIMGLGFSDIVPKTFQDSGRLLRDGPKMAKVKLPETSVLSAGRSEVAREPWWEQELPRATRIENGLARVPILFPPKPLFPPPDL